MKNAIFCTTIAMSCLVFAQGAIAANYIGVQYHQYDVSLEGLDSVEPDGVTLNLGGSLGQYVILEGRFGRSLSDDNGNGFALKVDDYIGFYSLVGMEVEGMFFPYVAIGYTKLDFEFYNQSLAQTESDISFGIGVHGHFNDMQVGLEWMQLQDKSDYDIESLSLSFAWRF